jgi:hypothetical protein
MAQSTVTIPVIEIPDGESATIVARLRAFDEAGTYLNTTNVTAFQVKIIDFDGTLLYELDNIPASVAISDTLIVDNLSASLGDTRGRNFKYVITPDLYNPEGGHVYLVEFVFATTLGGDLVEQWKLDVKGSSQ